METKSKTYEGKPCKKGHTLRYLKDNMCVQCHQAGCRAYYQKNKERLKAQTTEYYQTHKEEQKAPRKAYREKNKERINAKAREYYENNTEKVKAKVRAYRARKKKEMENNNG